MISEKASVTNSYITKGADTMKKVLRIIFNILFVMFIILEVVILLTWMFLKNRLIKLAKSLGQSIKKATECPETDNENLGRLVA